MREIQFVGPRILKNYNFLRQIARTRSDEKRINTLKNATPDELLALVEICSNILSSDFKLTTQQKKKFIPHADFVRRLARSRSDIGARKLIIQKGNGAFFASLLIPVVSEVARHLISSYTNNN